MKTLFKQGLLLLTAAMLLGAPMACKKKKDDPAPANNSNRPAGGPADKSDPSTAKSERVESQLVGGTTVGKPEAVKSELAGGDVNNFNALTGSTGSGLRKSEDAFVGWFIDELYVDGVLQDDVEFPFMFFFDGDNGWYDYYDFEAGTWEWGWWYTDTKMDYVVFDNAKDPDNIYRVKSISSRRIVLENTDTTGQKWTYVFNSYDLNDPNDFGDYVPTAGMNTITGGSSGTFYAYSSTTTQNANFVYTTMAPDTIACNIDDDYIFNINLSFNYGDKGTELDQFMECTTVTPSEYNEWWALLPDVNGVEDKIFYYLDEDGFEYYYEVVFVDANNLVLRDSFEAGVWDYLWLKKR